MSKRFPPRIEPRFAYRSLNGGWQTYEIGTLVHVADTTNEQTARLLTDALNACDGLIQVFGPSVDAYANYDGKGNHGCGWGEIDSVDAGREVLRKATDK